MSKLKFVDEPVRTSLTTTSTTGSATTGTANRPADDHYEPSSADHSDDHDEKQVVS